MTIEGVQYSLVPDGPHRLVLLIGGTASGIKIDFDKPPTVEQQEEFMRQAHQNLSIS